MATDAEDGTSYGIWLRHIELAPRLADTLNRMKAEGLFEKYRQETLQQLSLSR